MEEIDKSFIMMENTKNTNDSVVNPYGINYNPIGDTAYIAFAAPDHRNACGVWEMAKAEGVGVVITLQHKKEIECKFWSPHKCAAVASAQSAYPHLPPSFRNDSLAHAVEVRFVTVKNDPDRYVHIWYKRWVDGSIPDERDGLGVMQFLYNMVHVLNGDHKKIAVHCHAGRGRTGTLISYCIARDRPYMRLGEVEQLLRRHRKRAIQNIKQNRYLTLVLDWEQNCAGVRRGSEQELELMRSINDTPVRLTVDGHTKGACGEKKFKFKYEGEPWMKKKNVYKEIFNIANELLGCTKFRGRGVTGYNEHPEQSDDGKRVILVTYKTSLGR